MKKKEKTNPLMVQLINDLKKVGWTEKAPIWRDIAKRLEKPLNNWAEVNIFKISKNCQKGDTIVVPGKLLGTGDIDFSLTVAAVKASKMAKEKIRKAGGQVIDISTLVNMNPKGKEVRIMG